MSNRGITAQAHVENLFPARLEGMLPAAPADLLLLGEFPDSSVAALQDQDYRITRLRWRDHDFRQPLPAGDRGELLQIRLRAPELAGRRFDAVLALDLDTDIHPLALFDELDGLLAPNGVAVLAGPMTQGEAAHWLDHLAALGGRCGFSMDEPADDAASPSFLRVFRRSATPPRWRVNQVLPENFAEVSALFQEVFGHPMSRELWEWKYGAGRGNAVMARKGGNVVAHYGGMYRDILLCGKPDWAFQICDVMVHAKERGVLTRQGPFFLAAATCAEIYGPLGYGFPNKRAMQVAEKMGLYAKAGQMAEVRWSPGTTGYRLRTRVRNLDLDDFSANRALVNQVWDQMASDLRDGVVGERNWDYLEHRYFRHPHHHYEALLVSARFTGRPLGIAVLRRQEASCELLDVIAPLRNLGLVIDQARRMTGHWGLPYLYCWITSNYLPLFLACDGQEHALDISIPTSCWTSDPRSEQLKGKWWLMSGDTDFH